MLWFAAMNMKLTGLTANLLTHHIDRSLVFYRDVLGFLVTTAVPDAAPFVFVWLQRDGVSVFLSDLAAARHESPDSLPSSVVAGAAGIALFINTEGIDELWAAVKDRATGVMPLKTQWYGMTEFSVTDPDGYLITFAERKA